jgi:hypothetical protein
MRRKRPWTSPWRRNVTPEEAAETARILLEWLRDKPHAPVDTTAREKAVRDLFDVIEEGPPVELPAHSPSSKCPNFFRHPDRVSACDAVPAAAAGQEPPVGRVKYPPISRRSAISLTSREILRHTCY